MKIAIHKLITLLGAFTCCVCLNADVVNFKGKIGENFLPDKNWESLKNGNEIKFVENGISLNKDNKSSSNSIKYNKAFSLKQLPLTVSADFTYEQLVCKKPGNLISVGFTNGQSSISANTIKQYRVHYIALSINNSASRGVAVPIEELGIPVKKIEGKTDNIRLSLTLTKGVQKDSFDVYVSLQNLDNKEILYGFEQKNAKFEKGDVNQAFAYIQLGVADEYMNVKNRIVSNFEVSNKPANKMIDITPKGVDFSSFIMPIKPIKPLVKEGVWGASMLPRDTSNGLESAKPIPDYCYWDGSIVKDDKGFFHLYACRWDGNNSHSNGWKIASKGIHAVSDNLFGPYKDKGLVYPQWKEGKGSNVVGCRTFDGKYAVITSEITRGEIFIGDTADGPFEFAGEIKIDLNGHSEGLVRYNFGDRNMSNVQIFKRPDGRYMLVPRNACVLISEGQDIVGPYKVMTGRIFDGIKGVPQRAMEDPSAWYSGGMYHMLVNHWVTDITYHFSSKDGINDWKWRGVAFRKHTGYFRYTNGVENDWETVQRATAYTENDTLKAILFSVIDVGKGGDGANDVHGSKIIVVPFDGKNFDKAMKKLVREEESKK